MEILVIYTHTLTSYKSKKNAGGRPEASSARRAYAQQLGERNGRVEMGGLMMA